MCVHLVFSHVACHSMTMTSLVLTMSVWDDHELGSDNGCHGVNSSVMCKVSCVLKWKCFLPIL